MKINFKRSYKKVDKNGRLFTMFVYVVTGSAEKLAEYEEAMGDNFVKSDEGDILWFSIDRFVNQTNTLIKTSKGTYVADMSKFDQMASLASQYGGNFGQEIARVSAMNLLGMNAAPETAPVVKPTAVSKEIESKDQDLSEI